VLGSLAERPCLVRCRELGAASDHEDRSGGSRERGLFEGGGETEILWDAFPEGGSPQPMQDFEVIAMGVVGSICCGLGRSEVVDAGLCGGQIRHVCMFGKNSHIEGKFWHFEGKFRHVEGGVVDLVLGEVELDVAVP
jgi:hypothetical protein